MAIYKNSPPIVTNGLMFQLDAGSRLSYTSGSTTWIDLSNNGNNGTLTNGPTFGSANQGSILFDGTNDYVTGSLSQNPTTYTVNAWVNLVTNNTVGAAIFSSNGTGQTGVNFIFLQMGGGIKPFNFNNAGIQVSASLNTWNMVTGVQTATQQQLYVNSLLIDTKTASGSLGTNYIIGRRYDANYLNANIGVVQVYNRVLSRQEINQNYNALKSRYNVI